LNFIDYVAIMPAAAAWSLAATSSEVIVYNAKKVTTREYYFVFGT